MRPLSRFFRPPPVLDKLETPAAVLDEAAVRKLPDGEVLRDLAGLSAGASPATPRPARTAGGGSIERAGGRARGRPPGPPPPRTHRAGAGGATHRRGRN